MTRVTIGLGGGRLWLEAKKKINCLLFCGSIFGVAFLCFSWFRNHAQSLHHDSLLSRNFKPFTEHYKAWAHSLHFALSPHSMAVIFPSLFFLALPPLFFLYVAFIHFFSSAVALYHFLFLASLIKNVKSERVNSSNSLPPSLYLSRSRCVLRFAEAPSSAGIFLYVGLPHGYVLGNGIFSVC